jgi:hypothetical protein
MNMNNVTSSGDIRQRLFEERSDERPSTKGQGPANKANEDLSAFRFCTSLSYRQDLGAANATLQMIHKLLSNDRLLDFLAKANPEAPQTHPPKFFQAIDRLNIANGATSPAPARWPTPMSEALATRPVKLPGPVQAQSAQVKDRCLRAPRPHEETAPELDRPGPHQPDLAAGGQAALSVTQIEWPRRPGRRPPASIPRKASASSR